MAAYHHHKLSAGTFSGAAEGLWPQVAKAYFSEIDAVLDGHQLLFPRGDRHGPLEFITRQSLIDIGSESLDAIVLLCSGVPCQAVSLLKS